MSDLKHAPILALTRADYYRLVPEGHNSLNWPPTHNRRRLSLELAPADGRSVDAVRTESVS